MVMLSPYPPVAGVSTILGVVEKLTVAELLDVSWALTVWTPLALGGALNVSPLMVPVELDVTLVTGDAPASQ